MKEVTETEFRSLVNKNDMVLAKFFSQTCQPCKELAPVLEKISKVFNSKVKFVEVDVEKCPKISSEFGILGVPQMLLIQKGQEVDRLMGKRSEDSIKTWILDKI
ncbi:MAG TPA: thioredoxin family protein [Candidatus Nanoarchaeia archaeon]|nr:thioredoxin family protein [Candidatus Nanoarchaeia archaeon]